MSNGLDVSTMIRDLRNKANSCKQAGDYQTKTAKTFSEDALILRTHAGYNLEMAKELHKMADDWAAKMNAAENSADGRGCVSKLMA